MQTYQSQQLEVVVSIPADYVLIKKDDYKIMLDEQLNGIWWDMKELTDRTKTSKDWLIENVFYQPRFKMILDVKHNGFVKYPSGKGSKWLFQAKKMSEFLDDFFPEIMK
ncbi:DUF771 domain-containing protein [Listeria seeligeri]|uniref:DUF771 domain-containing protein n=1 Tax=Listeria seeligeri TaxID=1640 RepID=UPI00162443CE|nr:DUF771 domain-containing protein [Listeria seeligeri]MBC2069887.1 DUF771 domain-containing protein [Listeria seeligeri]MBC2087851.1 DUF771 domain-containing protein [Listeria seeligeri]MBF2400545.1 DUF771 domain-containing protein [Listeria seeligeri]MBF2499592.1 DUF771 domain-containing protein [Listeria seeligeri]MBF2651840.1 DUF771 domain-containing protein [Listeria seeligeri]